MNSDFGWTLQQVAESIPHRAVQLHAATSFMRPHDGIWPDDPKLFAATADEIMLALASDQQRIFLSVCLASYLLNTAKAPKKFKDWFQSHETINEVFGFEINFEELASCHWGRIAIPLADPSKNNKSQIAYAMAAASRTFELPLFPSWAASALNDESRQTVTDCSRLIAKRYPGCSLYFLPMINPQAASCAINGTSLGLPVYLSFYSLANSCSVPNILATGAVDKSGALREVGFLDEKFRLAEQKHFSSFLYPHFSGIKPLQQSGKVVSIGVPNLQQAERIWGRQSHDQNFVAYLERVKSNFRARISRFVHLKGQEEVALLNSYAVEHLPNMDEDEDDIVARHGTIEELRDKHVTERRMMLWGDAGMGKSTTLEYLAYKDADRKLKEPDSPLPVYLPLGLLTDRNASLKQIIWKRIGVDELAGESMLVDGNINLFLDGVNEIPKDMNNALINSRIREIQNLIDEYENTFIMVSNRQQSENIFHNIPAFIMQRMDEGQIEVFIQRNADDPTLAGLIQAEVQQNKRLARIVRTPLMLSRLIEVVRDEGTIPKSEGEIIHRFIHCLYNREKVEKKDVNFDIPKVHRLLRHLGYESLEDLDTNAGMTGDEVLRYFVVCMRKYGFEIDSMYVLDKATQLNILEKREDLYSFAHQAYQDYYHSQEMLHYVSI